MAALSDVRLSLAIGLSLDGYVPPGVLRSLKKLDFALCVWERGEL